MPSNNTVPNHLPFGQDSGCSTFRPGHQVHWIQARKGHQEEGGLSVSVHLEPRLGLVQIAAADGLHLYWHHYVDRIAKALNGETGQAIWSPHVHLLAVPDGTRGRTVFNLARLDQVQPCRS